MVDSDQKRSSEQLLAKRIEKEELEKAVDSLMLSVVDYRIAYPQAITECVIAANHAIERSTNEDELVVQSYRPPSVDFDTVIAHIRAARNEEQKEQEAKARLEELRRQIAMAKERETFLRKALELDFNAPI